MSGVRVLTSSLLGMLTDLVHTADRTAEAGVVGSVLLHTGRGYHGAEPGRVELLAGASTDRYCAGHTYAPCTGQLHAGPTLWSLRDAKTTIAVFKAARGRDPANMHAVEIHRSDGEITIREDPNLIDEGVSLSFGELEAFDYPARALYEVLDTRPDPAVTVVSIQSLAGSSLQRVAPTARTDVSARVLDPFSRVAKRRGELIQVYRHHQHRPILVQIGETYRGLLLPWRPVDKVTGDEDHPDAELCPPDLSDPRWRRNQRRAEDTDRDPVDQLAIPDLDEDLADDEDLDQDGER